MTEIFHVVAKITQAHIDLGLRGQCEECPVALALMDVFPDAKRITVGGMWINVFLPEKKLNARVSGVVSDFIENFDKGFDVQPMEFALTFSHVGFYQ